MVEAEAGAAATSAVLKGALGLLWLLRRLRLPRGWGGGRDCRDRAAVLQGGGGHRRWKPGRAAAAAMAEAVVVGAAAASAVLLQGSRGLRRRLRQRRVARR